MRGTLSGPRSCQTRRRCRPSDMGGHCRYRATARAGLVPLSLASDPASASVLAIITVPRQAPAPPSGNAMVQVAPRAIADTSKATMASHAAWIARRMERVQTGGKDGGGCGGGETSPDGLVGMDIARDLASAGTRSEERDPDHDPAMRALMSGIARPRVALAPPPWRFRAAQAGQARRYKSLGRMREPGKPVPGLSKSPGATRSRQRTGHRGAARTHRPLRPIQRCRRGGRHWRWLHLSRQPRGCRPRAPRRRSQAGRRHRDCGP